MRADRLMVQRARKLRRQMTPPEVILWQHLKRRRPDWPAFRRQHPVGVYILDFYCASLKLAVEVDGLVHGTGDHPLRDQRRDQWLATQGIEVMRVPAADIMADHYEVATWVWAKVEQMLPD